ncbi:MAG: hypothetical protein QM666_02310 [Acinetobacter sp.]
MQITSRTLILILIATLSLSACDRHKNTEDSTDTTASAPTSSTIQRFATTPNDAHDIAQFEQFNQNFQEISHDMAQELQQLKQQGQLNAEFVAQRKHDQTLSALNMLKDLDLKTEQGHYIQGLLSQFWENRLQAEQQQTASAVKNNEDQSLIVQAEQQLAHWKSVQKTSE